MAVTPFAPVARSNHGGRRAAVFLDKDGTLIEDVPYNVDPNLIRLTDGALDGLRSLHDAGYLLIVVSNQSGIARGYFEEQALGAVEQRMRRLLDAARVPLAGFYYCPHHPDGGVDAYSVECACRKPAPGLLSRAARDHGVSLGRSWMIGDILHDVEAGRRELYADATRRLVGDHGWQMVLTGSESERDLAQQISDGAGVPVHDVTGSLDLAELTALIASTPVLITNNTGPSHIAAAVGTPVVCLYALTNPQHTPWLVPSRVLSYDVPCRWCYRSVCPEGHHACLRQVPSDDVVRAALDLAAQTHA